MKVGGGSNLVVRYQVVDRIDDWVFGHFFFVVDGSVIGDASDQSVDLKGCLSWLSAFLRHSRNRYEPGLFEMPKDQVFVQLGASVLWSEDVDDSVKEIYEDTYARFHISHLGMSSFDTVILLLVEDERGNSRFIWKDCENSLHDAFFSAGEIERVLGDAVTSMKKEISPTSPDGSPRSTGMG